MASARAGNVIGGGDWAEDRLVPDAMRAFLSGRALEIRNPQSLRPWQHVLDPVLAYLTLAEHLVEDGEAFAQAGRFGPAPESEIAVKLVADLLVRGWGQGAEWRDDLREHPPEAAYLNVIVQKPRRVSTGNHCSTSNAASVSRWIGIGLSRTARTCERSRVVRSTKP